MATRRATIRRKNSSADDGSTNSANPWSATLLDEVCAVASLSVAVFLFASLVSHYHAQRLLSSYGEPSSNLMGPSGAVAGRTLAVVMGWCGFVPPILMLWISIYFWRLEAREVLKISVGERLGNVLRGALGVLGVLAFSCVVAAIPWGRDGGGDLGVLVAAPLVRWFNTAGAVLIASALFFLSLAVVTQRRLSDLAKGLAHGTFYALGVCARVPVFLAAVLWRLAGFLLTGSLGSAASAWSWLGFDKTRKSVTVPPPRRRHKIRTNDASSEDGERDARESATAGSVPNAALDEDPIDEELAPEEEPSELAEPATHVVVSRRVPEKKAKDREFVRTIARSTGGSGEVGEDARASERAAAFADYKLPPLSLLARGEPSQGGDDDAELLEKSRLIEAKLRDFGVQGKVTQVHPGPVITLFELEPAPGVKVGRIAALQDDLAMGLRASSIRIIAPIPRRGTVGIEIPNKNRDIVRLRDVLESDAFVNAESILSVCIGKDTYGDPVVADIGVMPHLLIAGATGTGKSVCINAVLLSLLYRASPAELGLIMIDPKILELSVYEGIPHLRVPVVSHPRQAKAVLQWAVDEMHRRYRVMQKFAVRNIDSYNRIVAGEREPEDLVTPPGSKVVQLTDEAVVEEGIVGKREGAAQEKAITPGEVLQPLPKIVIVIDELADLMLASGREIEELITRLAQKARASGIHLIVATQRPSVDVITGLIKANFPARLSFRVSSRVDSRTILDSMGSERLLGKGDMLLMMPGAEALRRVHGAFVADNEVKRVVATIKDSAAPLYDERIMNICEKALEEDGSDKEGGAGEGGAESGDEYDEVYDKAVELVVEKGVASTSMIQRVFRIGYNRAARIIEMMERDGVVGPMDGAKPREVLVNRQVEGT